MACGNSKRTTERKNRARTRARLVAGESCGFPFLCYSFTLESISFTRFSKSARVLISWKRATFPKHKSVARPHLKPFSNSAVHCHNKPFGEKKKPLFTSLPSQAIPETTEKPALLMNPFAQARLFPHLIALSFSALIILIFLSCPSGAWFLVGDFTWPCCPGKSANSIAHP